MLTLRLHRASTGDVAADTETAFHGQRNGKWLVSRKSTMSLILTTRTMLPFISCWNVYLPLRSLAIMMVSLGTKWLGLARSRVLWMLSLSLSIVWSFNNWTIVNPVFVTTLPLWNDRGKYHARSLPDTTGHIASLSCNRQTDIHAHHNTSQPISTVNVDRQMEPGCRQKDACNICYIPSKC